MANIKSAKKRILVDRRNAEISKAASKGVYHHKTASRKISRMTIAVNKIA